MGRMVYRKRRWNDQPKKWANLQKMGNISKLNTIMTTQKQIRAAYAYLIYREIA